MLLPPGVEAHSFEPKPTDIAKISEADIFIYTSEVMEPWVNNVLENISHKRLIIIKSTAVVNSETTEDDPHVWLDLTKAQKIVDSITGSLLDFDAPNAVLYLNNSKSYKEKLIALDDSYKRELLNCKNKEIILAGHSAFAYLAKRYNLDYLAAQGFSPDQEISSKQMIDLVKEIKEKKISSLYYEELIDPKMAQSLSRETGVKILELNAAHNIAKDDLKNGKTFLNIMSENLNNLKIGLECQL
ncbi:MAG: zinc ABC transporter substrate-binding protein [Planctomycetes bacterium]|nr:zinc ABC transporter substrate-binding protein [Planctomycetota bacterium]